MMPAIFNLAAPTPAEVMGVRTEVDSLIRLGGYPAWFWAQPVGKV